MRGELALHVPQHVLNPAKDVDLITFCCVVQDGGSREEMVPSFIHPSSSKHMVTHSSPSDVTL